MKAIFSLFLCVAVVCLLCGGVSARHRLMRSSLRQDSRCETEAKGKCQESTMQCDGKYISGYCPGAANIKCCAPASFSSGGSGGSGGPKFVCLTFDDGPFAGITDQISQQLFDKKVKATFFDNCHEGTGAIQAQVIKQGHSIADHMCSHDIMAVAHYQNSYGASKASDSCLTTDAQVTLFKKNVLGVVDMYEKNDAYLSAYKAAGVSPPSIKLIRFPGDGRFMKCLIGKLSTVDGVKDKNLRHVGWTYEIAPTGTFGHVTQASGVDGLSATEATPPRSGAIVLAHDLHYKGGKLPRLMSWVDNLLSAGYEFRLLNDDGKCV